jgi:hypothetical protein
MRRDVREGIAPGAERQRNIPGLPTEEKCAGAVFHGRTAFWAAGVCHTRTRGDEKINHLCGYGFFHRRHWSSFSSDPRSWSPAFESSAPGLAADDTSDIRLSLQDPTYKRWMTVKTTTLKHRIRRHRHMSAASANVPFCVIDRSHRLEPAGLHAIRASRDSLSIPIRLSREVRMSH